MYFKEFCAGVLQNSVQNTKCSGFFQVIKYDLYDNANEHFDFNARGGKRFRSWASINQPRT
jgi:hypothetical protein